MHDSLQTQEVDARLALLIMEPARSSEVPGRLREFDELCRDAGIDQVYKNLLMGVFSRFLAAEGINRRLAEMADRWSQRRNELSRSRWEV